ncbi:MAG: DNA recombination protein RmuC [Acidimicrobiales bacterium]|nr:DNA recombination protein RmuC [Acidimicrobiales bacterium]
MLIFIVLVALLAVLATGVAIVVVVQRTLRAHHDASLQAVTDHLAAKASEQFGRQSELTVSTVLELANDKLGQQTERAKQHFDRRHEVVERQIQDMNEELHQLRTLVAELQRERAQQHGQLVAGIEQALRASETVLQTTQGLRQALSNSRARGQWGERMADDVLRAAGFIEGINYVRQHQLADGCRPDVTFLLPQDRVLHMDVKFPVDNYLRFLEADGGPEAELHCKAFVRDVRARIKELTDRSYTDPETTVGYVLLFIPNEAVYGFIHEHDPQLVDVALSQRVVLCSPFTLFAVLGVIRQAIDSFNLARTSDEILGCLAGFAKQWTMFSERLDRLGKQLNTVQSSYEELAGTRRRQLERHLDRIEDLRSNCLLDDESVSAERPADRGRDGIVELSEARPKDGLADGLDPADAADGDARFVAPARVVGETVNRVDTVHARVPRLRPIRSK